VIVPAIGDGGDGSDEEVDQLDPSDGIIPEARATARVPNKTQPLFDESRQSSPEAETEMETVTQLAGGHASTSAIDITTAADDLFDDSQPGPPIFDPAKHTLVCTATRGDHDPSRSYLYCGQPHRRRLTSVGLIHNLYGVTTSS